MVVWANVYLTREKALFARAKLFRISATLIKQSNAVLGSTINATRIYVILTHRNPGRNANIGTNIEVQLAHRGLTPGPKLKCYFEMQCYCKRSRKRPGDFDNLFRVLLGETIMGFGFG